MSEQRRRRTEIVRCARLSTLRLRSAVNDRYRVSLLLRRLQWLDWLMEILPQSVMNAGK